MQLLGNGGVIDKTLDEPCIQLSEECSEMGKIDLRNTTTVT